MATRIALEEPSRSLWISEHRGGLWVRLQDGVEFRQAVPLDLPTLRMIATGAPRECSFWSDTARLSLRWRSVFELVAEYEDEERTVWELVSLISLGEALAELGYGCSND